MRNKSILALAVSFYVGLGIAGSPVIGTAITKGAFRIDNATVSGNATLFEGSLLETSTGSSSVQLSSGARFLLDAESRGHLFGDRLMLEKGSANLENGTGFHLVALGLTIQPERGVSIARVSLEGTRRVRVSSTRGGMRVLNSNGEIVANLAAGSALAFEPQAEASNITRVTGKLQNLSGHYVVVDEVTRIAVEVVGPGIAKEVGNRVEILGVTDSGATPVSDASRVIRIRELHSLGKADAVAESAGKGGLKGKPLPRSVSASNSPAVSPGTAAGAGTAANQGTAAAAGTAANTGTAAASAGTTAATASTAASAGGAVAAGTVATTVASAASIGVGTIAVVGGTAVAAAVGGLAAAEALPGQNGISR